MVLMDKAAFIVEAEKLAAGYQPSESTRQRLAQVDLVAVVGPTGVGKTSILDKLDVQQVKSDVTRHKRDGEKDDRNYHFRDDFDAMADSICAGEYAQFLVSRSGEFYGTHKDSYPQQGICAMAIVAEVIDVFRALGFRSVKVIYIMPPSYVEWMHRIGTSRHKDIHQRLEESVQSITIALKDPEYHFVLNDDLDTAVEEVQKIIQGEPIDEHRASLARQTTGLLLKKLGGDDNDILLD